MKTLSCIKSDSGNFIAKQTLENVDRFFWFGPKGRFLNVATEGQWLCAVNNWKSDIIQKGFKAPKRFGRVQGNLFPFKHKNSKVRFFVFTTPEYGFQKYTELTKTEFHALAKLSRENENFSFNEFLNGVELPQSLTKIF